MGPQSDIGSHAGRVGGTAALQRSLLRVEVVADGADWTILDGLDVGAAVAELAVAIAAHVELPAPNSTATAALSHDADVQALNKAWRGQDKPTNVLSFPSPAGAAVQDPMAEVFLGDVILAEATLACEAAAMDIAAADHFRHLVLHGLLHLLGFDHETDAEAARMEALETQILAGLGVADPYAGMEPAEQPGPAGSSPPPGATHA